MRQVVYAGDGKLSDRHPLEHEKLIAAERRIMVEWAQDRIAGCTFRDDAQVVGIMRDGALAAVFVFDTFGPSSCMMHVASDGSRRWLTRDLLMRAFAYPFVQCGFRRVQALISIDNVESIRLVKHLGAKQEGVMREAGDDREDLFLFGMLRRECRWLPKVMTPPSARAIGG